MDLALNDDLLQCIHIDMCTLCLSISASIAQYCFVIICFKVSILIDYLSF